MGGDPTSGGGSLEPSSERSSGDGKPSCVPGSKEEWIFQACSEPEATELFNPEVTFQMEGCGMIYRQKTRCVFWT